MAVAGLRLAVIGGGWAGLAAAVEAASASQAVTLFEMAPQLGGRAREVSIDGVPVDNGQHILIGAYTETLRLMHAVGVDLPAAMRREPLRLVHADGQGLHLPSGPAALAFARGVLSQRGWNWRDKATLLAAAGRWALQGFRCAPELDVATLTRGLGTRVRDELIDPLCVAALNTPAEQASAAVFLRVLHDALFAAPGAADLLLPRRTLSALWPEPAARWLGGRGAVVRTATRVQTLQADGAGWRLDGEAFDQVVLAAPALEAARLVRAIAPGWAAGAEAMRYEPIVTAYVRSEGTRLPHAMLTLRSSAAAPAQFVFDRGALGGPPGLLAFVISGAQAWVDRGREATWAATLAQARRELSAWLRAPLQPLQLITEKRATFRCTPALQRPAMALARGLHAAGDYVEGPYPATLEGAVRSGVQAVRAFG